MVRTIQVEFGARKEVGARTYPGLGQDVATASMRQAREGEEQEEREEEREGLPGEEGEMEQEEQEDTLRDALGDDQEGVRTVRRFPTKKREQDDSDDRAVRWTEVGCIAGMLQQVTQPGHPMTLCAP